MKRLSALFLGLALLFPIVAYAVGGQLTESGDWDRGGATPCYITSAASTNATNCRATPGRLMSGRIINTTSTIYYLRLYNLAAAPTCSSATGFVETIVVGHSSGAGGGTVFFNGPSGDAYSAGIGFCLTGGGSSTDNTNAATGVYVKLSHKS